MNRLRFCTILALVVLFSPVLSWSVTMDTAWTNTFYRGYFDSTNWVTQTADGGFIIVGITKAEGEIQTDIDLVKTDSDGNLEWSKKIGDENSECGFHILECSEGGYLISAQSTRIGDGLGGIWVLRTDISGDTLWTYSFAPEDRNGFPLHAIQTSDGGFAITGLFNLSGAFNDAFILQLDGDGGYVNYGHYGDEHYQAGRYITEMSDSGFIMVVWTDDPYSTSSDFRAIRTDKHLAVVWDSTYVLSDYAEEIYGACRVSDGIVMVGNNRGVAHTLKIDFDGHSVFSKSISLAPYDEVPYSVCPSDDGGVMVGGWIGVTGHRRDFCFIKLDSQLDEEWHFTVGGSQDDHGRSVLQASNGDYVMAGTSYSFYSGTCHYLARIMRIFNTTVGTEIEVNLEGGTSLTFDNVTGEGDTEVSIESTGPPLPGDYQIVPLSEPAFYNVTTSATYDGNIEICISYDPADVLGEEAELTLMHFDGDSWIDILTSRDTDNNILCGVTSTLSPFAIVEPVPLDVNDPDILNPIAFALGQNFPNPFNPTTTIEYTVPRRSQVSLQIFNVLGQKIRTLVDEIKPVGHYRITWDGKNDEGESVSSGIYFYRGTIGRSIQCRKMVLTK